MLNFSKDASGGTLEAFSSQILPSENSLMREKPEKKGYFGPLMRGPKANNIFSMKAQLSLLKSLDRSSLRIMPRVLEVLREWKTTWERIMLSIIFLPST